MASWINVDSSLCQISHWDDTAFSFGIYMDEYEKMDERTLPLHWHRMLEYDLVLSGSVEMRIDGRSIRLDVGDSAFINSNALHGGKQINVSQNAVVCAVCFSPDLLTENQQNTVYQKYFLQVFGKSPCGFKFENSSPEGDAIRDILRRLSVQSREDFGYELTVISMISKLWLHTLLYIKENDLDLRFRVSSPSRSGDIMKMLLTYVQENYTKRISVDLLASNAHISRSECFRVFKVHTGKAPLEYVNDYRLSQADHLLRTTSKSILDICMTCGFSGQSYFGELFKTRYGLSPAKYRKEYFSVIPNQEG